MEERQRARAGEAIGRLRAAAGPRLIQVLRGPLLAVDGVRALAAGDRPGARRRAAVLTRRRAAGGRAPGPLGAGLVRAALDAALVPVDAPARIIGPRAGALAEALADRLPAAASGKAPESAADGEVVVLAGALEAGTAREAGALLEALGWRPSLMVASLPLWPEARRELPDVPLVLLRGREWWLDRFARHGWEPALDLRRSVDGLSCMVLRRRDAERPRPRARAATVQAAGPRVRFNDDLSVGGSFAWISATVALALRELGVPVSIAPTRLAPSIEPERRDELESLIERAAPDRPADCEVGWTHFWHRYQRPLGGQLPLALFAINYEFGGRRLEDHDAWMRGLVTGDTPLAPISSFCRDVLADAGVAPERLHVVPMGHTDGIERFEPAPLPAARALRLLHVTNAVDAERNGTPLALAAFTRAFAPADDVTLVIRDYGGSSSELAARAESLCEAGYDVRYWPVFLAPDRLGALTGAFDALVAPFRGEGFGIKLLDAMACGVPVIGPLYGGPRDFLDADVAFPVAYDLVPVTTGYDAERLRLGNDPRWAECRVDDLAGILRGIAEDPQIVARRGAAARERVLSGFTWRHTAQRIADLAREVAP